MVCNVVADMHLLHLAVLGQFHVKVFIKEIEMLLQLFRIQLAVRIVRRVRVDIRNQDRLREHRFHVLARAFLTVTTGSNLVM
jgi:uncharacterized protein YybS (DUF2232 family)